MPRIDIKPLSVNAAYTGRRFSTPAKKKFTIEVEKAIKEWSLHDCVAPYSVTYVFGMSKMQDIDGAIKVFQDILCERLGINDNQIYHLDVTKMPVKKGEEYIFVEIETYTLSVK